MRAAGIGLVTILCVAQSAFAQDTSSQESLSQQSRVPAATPKQAALADDLSAKTDTELTALTAQWSHLSAGERRTLLAEVTRRMAATRAVRPSVGVRVQRRYGRVVRKRDGSVVLQTRVVEMRPAPPESHQGRVAEQVSDTQGRVEARPKMRGRVTFGIGFEQRSRASRRSIPPTTTTPTQQPPAVTVSQSQNPDQDR